MTALIVAIHLCLQPAAAFEYRENSPASLFPSGMAVHDNALAETIANPAYLPGRKNAYLSLAGARPYSLEEVSSFTTRAGVSGESLGGQVTWSGFGIDEYREHQVDLSTGVRPLGQLSFGMGAVYSHLAIHCGDYRSDRGIWEAHGAVLWEPFGWMSLAFRQENILALFERDRRDLLFPVWSAGLALRPLGGVDLLYGISGTNFGLLNTFMISARIFPFLCLVAGYQHETSSCGAALIISINRMMVSYGFRYHQALGMTHSVGVTLSYESRPFDSLDFGRGKKERPDPQKRVDINNCSEEQLMGIPVLSEKERKQILEYRAAMGPLSRLSLYQLGMKTKQVNDLLDYAYGLVEPERKVYRKDKVKSHAGVTLRRKKEVFAGLLGLGIKATTALKLADLSAAGKKLDLKHEIDMLKGVSPAVRDRIGILCGE